MIALLIKILIEADVVGRKILIKMSEARKTLNSYYVKPGPELNLRNYKK